jgi:hypothetical protein
MSVLHRILLSVLAVAAVACDEEIPDHLTAASAIKDDGDGDTAGDESTDAGGEGSSDGSGRDTYDPTNPTLSPKLENCRHDDGAGARVPGCDP